MIAQFIVAVSLALVAFGAMAAVVAVCEIVVTLRSRRDPVWMPPPNVRSARYLPRADARWFI